MSGCEREMTKQEMIEQIRSLIDENAVLKSKLEDVYESVGLKKVENAEKYRNWKNSAKTFKTNISRIASDTTICERHF